MLYELGNDQHLMARDVLRDGGQVEGYLKAVVGLTINFKDTSGGAWHVNSAHNFFEIINVLEGGRFAFESLSMNHKSIVVKDMLHVWPGQFFFDL